MSDNKILRKHKKILSIQALPTQGEIDSIIGIIYLKILNNFKLGLGFVFEKIRVWAVSWFYFPKSPGLGSETAVLTRFFLFPMLTP